MLDSYTHSHTFIPYFGGGKLSLTVFLCVSVCVITKITGGIMEHSEPQPPFGFFPHKPR